MDKVLSYDHSNEASSAVLLNGTGGFVVFYKMRLFKLSVWPHECKSTAESRLHATWVSAPLQVVEGSDTNEVVIIHRYSGKLEATAQLNKLKSLVLAIQKGLSTVLAFGFLGLGFW